MRRAANGYGANPDVRSYMGCTSRYGTLHLLQLGTTRISSTNNKWQTAEISPEKSTKISRKGYLTINMKPIEVPRYFFVCILQTSTNFTNVVINVVQTSVSR